jgi:putative DNA primase/helicase
MSATSASGVDATTVAKAKLALGRAQDNHDDAVAALGQVYAMPADLAKVAVAVAATPKFQQTDYGNAERLVHHHGRDIRFVSRWGSWLVWDGRRWRLDDTGEVQRRAKATVRAIYAEAAREADEADRKSLAQHGRYSESAPRLRDMVRLAQSEPGIPVAPSDFDADGWSLNVDNGIVDLRTGELRPHQPTELHTKLAPAAFDAAARAPRWDAFLEEVLPDAAVRHFVQKFVGYSLTGSVSEQVLAFLYGAGANGKSVFLGALRAVLGDYAMEAAPDLLVSKRERSAGDLSAVADLRGRRFVSTSSTTGSASLKGWSSSSPAKAS